MIDRIMGGEQHVVGKTEYVLRHNRSCGDDGKASKGIATWRVAEDSNPKWTVLIRRWIKSMTFHSRNPRHPSGIRQSNLRSIVLVIFVPMTYVFQLFLSFNLCHSTHIRSYLNSTPICPTHFHSFAYSSLSYLWCAYLISVAIAIKLDHSCD